MLYILQIFLYYFIQGLKTLTTTQRNRSPRQRDFFMRKIYLVCFIAIKTYSA